MIAGTSTGGLIALMLGRLKMTVPECIAKYAQLAADVFSHENWIGSKFDANRLATAIKGAVKEKLKDENAIMLDDKNACKVFVVSCRDEAVNNAQAVHLRTYINPLLPSSYSYTDWKIWEAGRATSAAPTYFDYLEKDGYTYTDGGLRFNNPVMELLIEASSLYPKNSYACLVSIGTGLQSNIEMPEGGAIHAVEFLKALSAIATSCETANLQAGPLFTNVYSEPGADKYCRLNMGIRVADSKPGIMNYENQIDLADYKKMNDLANSTDLWLKQKDVQDQVAKCVGRLKLAAGKVIPKDLAQPSTAK
jgi:patatin-like phospholipase/acyl hydrolase